MLFEVGMALKDLVEVEMPYWLSRIGDRRMKRVEHIFNGERQLIRKPAGSLLIVFDYVSVCTHFVWWN